MNLDTIDLWDHAQEAAKRGMEASGETCGDPWLDYAYRFCTDYLRRHRYLHVDDLWEQGLEFPANAKGLGQVISRLKRDGSIDHIPIANIPRSFAARPSVRSNGQVKLVWKSMLYEGMREGHAVADLMADMADALRAAVPWVPADQVVAIETLLDRAGQPR